MGRKNPPPKTQTSRERGRWHRLFEDSTRKRRGLAVILSALVVASLVTSASLFAVRPASAQTTAISSCTTIDRPGQYELTRNITNSTTYACIRITASDVTLDGNGHTIDGYPQRSVEQGIRVYSSEQQLTNVTVENLTLANWHTAVSFEQTADAVLRNNTAISIGFGFSLSGSPNSTIENNTAKFGEISYHIVGSAAATLRNNTANDTRDGFIIESSRNATLRNNTALNQRGDGFIIESSPSATLLNNTANETRYGGYNLVESVAATLRNNTAIRTGQGFDFENSSDSFVRNNTATDNDVGFSVYASNITLLNNTASNNYGRGFYFATYTDGIVQNNVATDNTQDGFSVVDSLPNAKLIFRNNTATRNGEGGFTLFRSSAVHLQNNTATNNSGGFVVSDSSNIHLRNNTATDNDNGGGVTVADGTGIELVSNEFRRNDDGVRTRNVSDLSVRQNAIVNNSRHGIDLTSATNATVTNNAIAANGEVGLRLENTSNATVRRNVIARSGAAGVAVTGSNSTSNLLFDNALNNSRNVELTTGAPNAWNVSEQSGPNVIGGPFLGGNYYATPNGTGFSQTCADANNDGFCDEPNDFGVNNTDFLPLTRQPNITVSPSAVDFGTVPTGDTATANVTVTNSGTAPLDVSATDIVGRDASDFDIVGAAAPFSLESGESRNVTIEFAPTRPSKKTATLRITNNDTDDPTITVALSGRAVKGEKTVFPNPLVIEKRGVVLFKFDPPQDLTGDGLYEDANGDGRFTSGDVAALAIIATYQRDHLDLNDEQVAALDFDRDGKLTQGDVGALARDLFSEDRRDKNGDDRPE
ncbi:right-handed parallel beta-helix repeat-containing protein [Haladaptatus salinisoli]|uniref:right-handed parallel beta-helix repeat-containing protein n=1 Tax=Haladaptatus salinisoli TaxID=2884876 RepID=UPI001D0ACE9E|nr:right-handed parallel beta-helix repeat-containing protein [Haladaptatus salinisoli]